MIECSSRRLPPTGCLQYLTGATGTVTSFNYRAGCTSHPCTHLQSHQYTVHGGVNYTRKGVRKCIKEGDRESRGGREARREGWILDSG